MGALNEKAYGNSSPDYSKSGAMSSNPGNSGSNHASTSEVSQDLQKLGKLTGTLATDAANLVQESASHYYDKGIEQAKKGLEQAKKLELSLEAKIQENPLRSLLIAAGVGLTLGALWSRR